MRRLLPAALVAGFVLVVGAPALAHPLGNFTTNTATMVTIAPDEIEVLYVVDLAEIPAFQVLGSVDRGDAGLGAWGEGECAALAPGLTLKIDDRRVDLAVSSTFVITPPGTGGLSTLRLECTLGMNVRVGSGAVTVIDDNFPDRIGWREIVIRGDGTTIEVADAPAESPSGLLRSYPAGVTPHDQRRATATVLPGGAAAPAATAGTGIAIIDEAAARLTSLIGGDNTSIWLTVAAMVVAMGLGGMHALAPGHGKTIMAAAIVGNRGRLHQTAMIGVTVAITHTAGVVLLGLVLSLSRTFASERIFPMLGLASGLLVVVIGVGMLRRGGPSRHGHDHGDPDQHHHDDHQEHDHDGHSHPGHGDGFPTRSAVAMGLAGGLVPSPTALLVLLGAMAVGRAWLGLVVVLAYGIGMATVLVAIGIAISKGIVRSTRGRRLPRRLLAIAPTIAGWLVVGGGALMAVRAMNGL